MFDLSRVDLEVELKWRRARKVANETERAVNEARIAALNRMIAKPRNPVLRLEFGLEPAPGSPTALIVVLIGYTLVGVLVSL